MQPMSVVGLACHVGWTCECAAVPQPIGYAYGGMIEALSGRGGSSGFLPMIAALHDRSNRSFQPQRSVFISQNITFYHCCLYVPSAHNSFSFNV